MVRTEKFTNQFKVTEMDKNNFSNFKDIANNFFNTVPEFPFLPAQR